MVQWIWIVIVVDPVVVVVSTVVVELDDYEILFLLGCYS